MREKFKEKAVCSPVNYPSASPSTSSVQAAGQPQHLCHRIPKCQPTHIQRISGCTTAHPPPPNLKCQYQHIQRESGSTTAHALLLNPQVPAQAHPAYKR